ncbi:MAG: hypothetical protein V4717_01475 [Bacteroidota bacterium]
MITSHPLKRSSIVLLYFICLVAITTACGHRQKFEKQKWNEQNETGEYPFRQSMLNDLMEHHGLKGKSYYDVIDLVGEPEKKRNNKSRGLYYNILKKVNQKDEPVYIKNLILRLTWDSVVDELAIEEIKND